MSSLVTTSLGFALVASTALGGPPTQRNYGPGYAGPIPDNDAIGYLSPIVVPDSFPVQSIEIRLLGLQHDYCSDLTIELRHAGVSAPTLLATNIRFGNSADFDGDYTFSDDGDDLWIVTDGLGGLDDIPPGDYRASGENGMIVDLDARYIGEDAAGPWTLRIYDDDFLVSGMFTGWELVLGGAPACLPSDVRSDLDGDGSVGSQDLAELIGNWGPVCP